MKTPRFAPSCLVVSATALLVSSTSGQTIGLVSAGHLTGTFDGPGGIGSFPEIRRTSTGQHFYYPANGQASTLPTQYTQPAIASGGQTGGGFEDGGIRVAECAMKIGISYNNGGPHPLIEVRKMTRTFLASGYTVVGSMSTPNTFQGTVISVAGTGTTPFSIYQSGTPGFLNVTFAAVAGTGAVIVGNFLTPGQYRISASTSSASMNSSTAPHELTKDSSVRIVLGLAPCYANCDGSIATPVLTPNDFQCFLDKFASGNTAANCDNSTSQPMLTPNDFQCFLDEYAAGCS